MKKKYDFDYDMYEAYASFVIDTEIFTPEVAQTTLDFYLWDYDEEADPIEEVMKKYALKAIETATSENYNTHGVKEEFKRFEGFCNLDGSNGIELINISRYEFSEEKLTLKIKEVQP